MGKSKQPRKPKSPTAEESPRSEAELEPPREPAALPERRRLLPQRSSPAPSRHVLYELVQTIRTAVSVMLDIADAAAETITKRLKGRA
jgi:hypothetical protein